MCVEVLFLPFANFPNSHGTAIEAPDLEEDNVLGLAAAFMARRQPLLHVVPFVVKARAFCLPAVAAQAPPHNAFPAQTE